MASPACRALNVRSRPALLTFCPRSVTSLTPAAARASTSLTISADGRLISRPRTAGTMQKAQELSQPIWMVIHVEYAGVPASRERGREPGVVVGHRLVQDLGDGAIAAGLVQQERVAVHVVGAEDDVHVGRLRPHQVPVLLSQAAGHDDLAVPAGRGGVLPPLELAEVAVQLVVGVLPDAAGVEHDDVGLVDRRRRHQPVTFQQPGDALRVVLVHLAPEGAHDVGAGGHRKAQG